MTAAIAYVVICDCSTPGRHVVHIDDEREIGGTVRLTGIETLSAVSFATAAPLPNMPIEYTLRHADRVQSEYSATTTVWPDWHLSRAIRCIACGEQAQMTQESFIAIANELAVAARRGALHVANCDTGRPQAAKGDRYVIPFGVLRLRAARPNG